MKIKHWLLLLPLLFWGCDAFDYHPYSGNIRGEKDINRKNIVRIEAACKDKDTIRFAFIGDTQGNYDDTKRYVKHINKRTDIDFTLHGGDVVNYGLTKEFTNQRDILQKLKAPYVVLLGNHDCVANGYEVFRNMFGEENFTFKVGNFRFVCLNTNGLEFNYPDNVPDFKYMDYCRNMISDTEKTIVAMHAPPCSEQFKEILSEVFQERINRYPNLQFCINAHIHNFKIEDLFGDGVIYYATPTIKKRGYIIFTLTPDDYEYELVEF